MFSHYNWNRAQAEIKSGQKLREAIFYTISQIANDIEAQAQATNFALRTRKHEIQKALNELNWQKKQVRFCKIIYIRIFYTNNTKFIIIYLFI